MTSRGTGLIVAAAGAMLACMPAQAQTIAAAETAYLVVGPEIRVKTDEDVEGLWLRTTATVRTPSETWRADETSAGVGISVQKEVIGHTWLGVTGYTQAPRFDTDRGLVRDARHYAGARMSFEASDHV